MSKSMVRRPTKPAADADDDPMDVDPPHVPEKEKPRSRKREAPANLADVVSEPTADVLDTFIAPQKLRETPDIRWPTAPAAPRTTSETPKAKKAREATRLSTKVVEDLLVRDKKPLPAGPLALDEKNRYLSQTMSANLNELGVQKILGIDKSALDANREASVFMQTLARNYATIMREKAPKTLGSEYRPTTTSSDYALPTLPKYDRAFLVAQLRAPLPMRGERQCKHGTQCEGYYVYEEYQRLTADNEAAGPQFPPHTKHFALKEFSTPETLARIRAELAAGGKIGEIMGGIEHGACLLCILNATNALVMMLAMDETNSPIEPGVQQPFSVIVGVPGEYRETAQLTCGSRFCGLVDSFPAYRRDQYVPFMHHVTDASGARSAVAGWAEHTALFVGPEADNLPRGESLPSV